MKLSIFEVKGRPGSGRKTVTESGQTTAFNFYCNGEDLSSLGDRKRFGPVPMKVENNFDCRNNRLTNLIGGPTEVGGFYHCNYNHLVSLEGVAPKFEHLSATNNKLTSLKGIHKLIKEVGHKDSEGSLNFCDNPIESHVLGLLKIKGLTKVFLDNIPLQVIINAHLIAGPNVADRDILACQEALLNAGFEKFAQL